MRLLVLLLMSQIPGKASLADRVMGTLQKHCVACHCESKASGNLVLSSREAMLQGGDQGPALVPFDYEASAIYQTAGSGTHALAVLNRRELDDLKDWIDLGAPLNVEPASAPERALTKHDRSFWAFQLPRKPRLPQTNGAANPIDALLGNPASQADRRTLARRVFLDLWGVPPSPEEAAAFLNDQRPDAWERLVDRLIASPRYGERWAQVWLDLVRFAESTGFEFDWDRPDAWRYRDWVVDAFNSGKPYDRFAMEQLAGDELWPDSGDARIATGFLRLGVENNLRDERTREEALSDVVSTVGAAFLGLTVGCARCHHHKYDPVSRADYERVRSVFANLKPFDYPLADEKRVAQHRKESDGFEAARRFALARRNQTARRARMVLLEHRVAKLPAYLQIAWRTPAAARNESQRLNARQIERTFEPAEPALRDAMSADERAEYDAAARELADLDARKPAPLPSAQSVAPLEMDRWTGRPGGVAVLSAGELYWDRSAARSGLARWITSSHNPLTARVMANRMWQRLFGSGLVATANNFGRTGARPTAPELLDWLACELVEQGWSVKQLDRLLLSSLAYRRATKPMRLDAEAIRDSMLSAAGVLRADTGGPGFRPRVDTFSIPPSVRRGWEGLPDKDSATWRRSLYAFRKRTVRYPLLEVFDQPDMSTSCARRHESVSAAQALVLMNNEGVREWARLFAERIRREAGGDVAAQVDRGFAIALGRAPAPAESERSMQFVRTSGLEDFCHALFNLNEFVYRP